MKIKTDSSHKSFSVKSMNTSKIKRIAIKIGATLLAVGTLFVMSGCQSKNETIVKLWFCFFDLKMEDSKRTC